MNMMYFHNRRSSTCGGRGVAARRLLTPQPPLPGGEGEKNRGKPVPLSFRRGGWGEDVGQ